MSIKCALGIHDWDGCKCYRCRKTRNRYHRWNNGNIGCKCTVCGKKRDKHDAIHQWRGCKCISCDEIRDEHHGWHLDCTECPLCHKKSGEQHDWSNDCEKCSKCAQTRINEHDWTKNIEVCAICGKGADKGTFTDHRDGRKYQWIRIKNQVIMAENLAYQSPSGNYWIYNESEHSDNSVETFGYLYDWETANKVAPEGWHLPTAAEWKPVAKDFEKFVMEKFYTEHWPKKEAGNSYNILGGWRNPRGICSYARTDAYLWSSTESGPESAIALKIYPAFLDESYGASSGTHVYERGYGLSVILFRNY